MSSFYRNISIKKYLMQAGPAVCQKSWCSWGEKGVQLLIWELRSIYNHLTSVCDYTHAYQKRWPHKLITASLEVSKQMLHSNVLSWVLFSPCVWVLEPVPVLSVAEELDDWGWGWGWDWGWGWGWGWDGGEALAMLSSTQGTRVNSGQVAESK